jgi:hypothetical protein
VFTSFIVTDVIPGSTVKFRVSARNIQGWGTPTEDTITAAQAPEEPSPITTSIDGINVVFEWISTEISGSPVDTYNIQIQGSDGNYYTHSS